MEKYFEIVSTKLVKLHTSEGHIIFLDNNKKLLEDIEQQTLYSSGNFGPPYVKIEGVAINLHRYIFRWYEKELPSRLYLNQYGDVDNSIHDFRYENFTEKVTIDATQNHYFVSKDGRSVILQVLNKKGLILRACVDNDANLIESLKMYLWVIPRGNSFIAIRKADGTLLSQPIKFWEFLFSYLRKQFNVADDTPLYRKVPQSDIREFRKENMTLDFKDSYTYSKAFVPHTEKFFAENKKYSANRFSTEYQHETSERSIGFLREKSKLDMEIIERLREMYITGKHSQQDLANYAGISRNSITDILNFKTWNPHHVTGIPSDIDTNIPVLAISKSTIQTQSDIHENMLNDFVYKRFAVDNLVLNLYKPVFNQFYFEIYREDVYLGSIQYRYFSEEEIHASGARRKLYNIRPISIRFRKGSNITSSDMFIYVNSISDYFAKGLSPC